MTKNTPDNRRHTSSLIPPGPNITRSAYPSLLIGPNTKLKTVFRAHSHMRGNTLCDSRFFASFTENVTDKSSAGRFDLPRPAGTCNTAVDEYTAFRERLGRTAVDGLVSETFVSNTLVTELRIKRPLLLADFSKPGPGYIPGDITGPLPGEDGYQPTQQWSQHMYELGFDGIIARARHNDGYAIYLFGPAGVQEDFFDVVGTRLGMDVYWEMSAKGEFLPKLMTSDEDFADSLIG